MISDDNDLEIVTNLHKNCIEELYFWYMKSECDCECGNCTTIDGFMNDMLLATKWTIERLHDKYADHIEGLKRK